MDFLYSIIDFFLHLDKHLFEIINNYGTLTYLILFLIIFTETGVVIMPFLPGDSLLFAAGALAAGTGALNIFYLFILFIVGALLGDTTNYFIGNSLGNRVFTRDYRFFKKDYLIKTQKFYEKHGGKTIIIARFIPIIRTFAPFVAGVGTMKYKRFISFSIFGAIFWVSLFLSAGFFFGNIPFVKNNFSVVIVAIILISMLPPVVEYLRNRIKERKLS